MSLKRLDLTPQVNLDLTESFDFLTLVGRLDVPKLSFKLGILLSIPFKALNLTEIDMAVRGIVNTIPPRDNRFRISEP